jgi:hypothetical protein
MATLLFLLSAVFSAPSFAIPHSASVTELTRPAAREPGAFIRKLQSTERAATTKSPYGNAHLMLAGVDYCYAGSVIDPGTGVRTERFVICPGNGIEQNLDLA